jgi:hypothetical protein
MKTFDTSLSACVDLFFKIGGSRGKSYEILPLFVRAYNENPECAIRILLWTRDVRGGAGERQLFKDLVIKLAMDRDIHIERIIDKVPEIGRWDDLLSFIDTPYWKYASGLIRSALEAQNGLAAKWMPRKGEVAARLRKELGWSPKYYRKTLVGLTKVVETQMCSKEWNNIEFGKVPSLAAARYSKAFERNATEAYSDYKDKLVSGEEKVNAGAVYPYDVLKTALSNPYSTDLKENKEVILSQCEALPDYLDDSKILPMIDLSGSMRTPAAGTLSCMDVAISLGLYLADKNKGDFSDMFISFTDTPTMHHLKGNVLDKLIQMADTKVGYSTNLAKAFDCLLDVATSKKVDQSDMPTHILVLSDMEFDDWSVSGRDVGAFKMAKIKYREAGYELPNLVFWNLNSRSMSNVPVKKDKTGTALISGFSPAIMKSVLACEDMSPENIMIDAVGVDRYNVF